MCLFLVIKIDTFMQFFFFFLQYDHITSGQHKDRLWRCSPHMHCLQHL